MIIGIGTDVCSIERIRKSLERFGDRLVHRILGATFEPVTVVSELAAAAPLLAESPPFLVIAEHAQLGNDVGRRLLAAARDGVGPACLSLLEDPASADLGQALGSGSLTNLLYNQLVPRVRTKDWTIDVSGGTRKNAIGVRYRFGTSALSVLALKGGRNDLRKYVQPQTRAVLADYKRATTVRHSTISYWYGNELAPIYQVLAATLGG